MTDTPRLHGGPDALGAPQHDFSTNSNAYGPCPHALAAVQSADASCYPDPSYTELREQLAAFHGVDATRVLLAGSASEFIFRITAWLTHTGRRTVCVPKHCYGDYADAAQAWGLRVVRSGTADLHWHADPSSPLGQSPELEMLACQTPSTLTIVDRAYEPLRLSRSSAPTSAQFAHVWQLWSPNKALGLTGVRAAYAIAPDGSDKAVDQLENLCASWPVGAHGVAMLQAWVQPTTQTWLADSLTVLKDWKDRQICLMQNLGWVCLPSNANFFCALHSSLKLESALQRLRRRGIKLRDATSFGLPGYVRLSVKSPRSQDALKLAWEELVLETPANMPMKVLQ